MNRNRKFRVWHTEAKIFINPHDVAITGAGNLLYNYDHACGIVRGVIAKQKKNL